MILHLLSRVYRQDHCLETTLLRYIGSYDMLHCLVAMRGVEPRQVPSIHDHHRAAQVMRSHDASYAVSRGFACRLSDRGVFHLQRVVLVSQLQSRALDTLGEQLAPQAQSLYRQRCLRAIENAMSWFESYSVAIKSEE